MNIKKMKRMELLEIILEQEKKIKSLEEKLNNKEILIKESGSMAEAALKLNDIFRKADEACQQYLYNIKKDNKNEKY